MARYLSRESEPYGKWKGIPIYLTTILTAVFVAGLFLSAALFAGGSRTILLALTFDLPSDSWTELTAIFTYPFIERVSFFTPFGILFFYWLSVGIETHLGRGVLTKLLLLLVLTPVAVAAAAWWGFRIPTIRLEVSGLGLSGTFLLYAAMLIGFATLYPQVEAFGWIPFKWVAFACVVCGSLMQIASHDWIGLVALWASCLASFLYIRHAVEQEYDDHVPLAVRLRGWFRRKPKLRVVSASEHTTYRERRRERDIPSAEIAQKMSAEVDALLEKIARNGISSLTSGERAKLEKAREELLKKERK